MKSIKWLSFVLIALVLLGCSFTVNVPTLTTGNTNEFKINEPFPAGVDEADVTIEMGGGRLNIIGGSSTFIEGSVLYNVDEWKPTTSISGDSIILSQSQTKNVGIPSGDIKNNWDLQFGKDPFSLNISAGAYEGTLDLSGLALTNLKISDGASKAEVRFDSKNPVEMQRLTYKTGASNVDLLGLANANTSEITFESGAGAYTLDFSGDLSRDLTTNISSGLSQVKIVVPQSANVVVNITGGLSNVDLHGTWTTNGTEYTTGGTGPTITVNINMAVGNLVLDRE